MKLKLHITGLSDNGDQVTVTAQGSAKRTAQWRPMERWEFTVPVHIGKHYKLGQTLRVKIE